MNDLTKKRRFAILIISILALLGFGPGLGNGLSLDDEFVINERTQQGLSGIPDLLSSNYYDVEGQKSDYRPVHMISYAIEHELFGENHGISHFINLLLYIFVCLAVHSYLVTMFGDEGRFLSLIAVAIFTIHPLHTEVVYSLKNRDELFTALFGFMATTRFLRMKDYSAKNWSQWLIVALLLFLSALSKKTGYAFFGIIIISQLFQTGSFRKTAPALVTILPIATYKIILGRVIGFGTKRQFMGMENPLYEMKTSLLDRLPMASGITLDYIGLFAVPNPLRYYYGYNQVELHEWSSTYGVISFLLILGTAAACIYFWRTKHPVVFGAIFFLATMTLYSNLFKPAVGIMAERFVFVPILGLCIIAAWGLVFLIQRMTKDKPGLAMAHALPLLIIVPFMVLSFQRGDAWESRRSLYEADMAHLEESAKAHMMLADIIQFEEKQKPRPNPNELRKAIHHFERVTEIYPEYTRAYNNAASIYLGDFQEVDKAQALYQQIIKVDSTDPQGYLGTGVCQKYLAQSRFAQNPDQQAQQLNMAVANFRKAYDMDPQKMMEAKRSECEILMFAQNGEALITASNEALNDGHRYPGFYIFKGNGHYFNGNLDSAFHYYEVSYELEAQKNVCQDIVRLAAEVGRDDLYNKYKPLCEQ